MAYDKKSAKKKILNELESVPVVLGTCSNLGIPRPTFYRWRKEDEKFKNQIEKAKARGRETMCELAESVIMQRIHAGEIGAAKYWLENHDPRYIRPRSVFRPPRDPRPPQSTPIVLIGKGEQFETIQEFDEFEKRQNNY